MVRSVSLFAASLLGVLAPLACSDSSSRDGFEETKESSPTSPSPSAGGAASGSPSSPSSPGAPKGDGSVGSSCAGDAACASGLSCLTEIPPLPQAGFAGMKFPGGYCSKKCGQPDPDNPATENLSPDCGASAACEQQTSSTGQGGQVNVQMCVRTCRSEADCRAAEGYSCKTGPFGSRSCRPL